MDPCCLWQILTQSFKKKKSILSNFGESVSTVASVSCSLSGAGCGPLLLQGSVCFQRCSSAYFIAMRGYLSHCCRCLYIKKVIFQCYRKAKTSPRLKGVKEQKENNILSYIACSFLLFCLKRWIPGLPEQPKQHNVFVYASWTWINTGMKFQWVEHEKIQLLLDKTWKVKSCLV